MANRRMGGMGGGPRGNRSFSQQPFQGGSLNPWQGAMPQNSMNQGLFSQISSNPQQLALALSSLLQNQQQNPPSLLSLPTPPAFSNQGGDFNRFGNRGRDFRRHEPYNKNRNAGGRNNDNRRRGNQNQHKRDDQKKFVDKKEDKVVDLSTDDGGEEKTSKRDWKDEKNVSEEKKNEGGEEGRNKDGIYSGIPKEYLNCFVCNKQMWDGESMYKHVKGRAHRQTLETLEESIHITVNILRENMRLLEEKKVIELERMQRLAKKYNKFQEQESHCNMCDLKFLGKIINHRKTEGHQRLKRYLHPVCNLCDKEFPSRVEWIEHRLTPEHLKNLSEKMKDRCGGADGDVIVNEDEQDLALEPLLEEPLQMEEECPILELTDDLASLQNLMPAYKPDRAISTKSLVEFTGFRCELCNRSFESEDLAQKHLKTRRHYHAFIEVAKKKYKEQQKAKDSKKVEEEKQKTENDDSQADGDQEMYDPEEATNEDDSAVDGDNTQEEVEGEGDPSVINNSAELIEMVDEEEAEPEEEEMPEPPPPPKKQEVKKEPPKPVTSTPKQVATPAKAAPAPARAAPAAAATAGGVKNGAGPKSKKVKEPPKPVTSKPVATLAKAAGTRHQSTKVKVLPKPVASNPKQMATPIKATHASAASAGDKNGAAFNTKVKEPPKSISSTSKQAAMPVKAAPASAAVSGGFKNGAGLKSTKVKEPSKPIISTPKQTAMPAKAAHAAPASIGGVKNGTGLERKKE